MKRFQRAFAVAVVAALAAFPTGSAALAVSTTDLNALNDSNDSDVPALRTSDAAPKYGQTYYLAPPATTYYYAYPTYVAAPTYVYPTPIGPPVQVWFP